MAIIKGTNKILKSDIPDAPPWFDKVLSVLNGFLDTVIGALRGKLTFRENMYCEIREFTFTDAQEKEILYTKVNDVKGVIIIGTPPAGINEWAWRKIRPNTIGITITFGGFKPVTGDVKFIILG